jgi:hypothetical protein
MRKVKPMKKLQNKNVKTPKKNVRKLKVVKKLLVDLGSVHRLYTGHD